MKVKIIDANHELDLEEEMNKFLSSLETDVIDIKYQVALSDFTEDQVYSFSAMIIYRK